MGRLVGIVHTRTSVGSTQLAAVVVKFLELDDTDVCIFFTDLIRGLGGAIEKIQGRRGHSSLVPNPAIAGNVPVLADVHLVTALRYPSMRYRRFHLWLKCRQDDRVFDGWIMCESVARRYQLRLD